MDQQKLSSFMKKKASEKLSKNHSGNWKKANLAKLNSCDENKSSLLEEMSEDEKLEQAKRESRGKAENYNKSEFIKKLIIEEIVKYVVLISVIIILAVGFIKLGPVVIDFLGNFLRHLLFLR